MQTASRVFDKKRRFQPASDRPVFVQTNEISPSAGVSARAWQLAFCRFRDRTPMAHLRALRLDVAPNELARARRDGGSVTSVANAHGFGSLSRFAPEYQGALPRAAFRSAAPRRRWTLSYRVLTPRLSFLTGALSHSTSRSRICSEIEVAGVGQELRRSLHPLPAAEFPRLGDVGGNAPES
jgi:AraC-like DNA-binding protein